MVRSASDKFLMVCESTCPCLGGGGQHAVAGYGHMLPIFAVVQRSSALASNFRTPEIGRVLNKFGVF